ncbi:heavy metal translocating P-type ATPase [Microbulbifer bruguierae]|uniref:Heavy metal translocating P-type ATPase n=1 Tax=Microbulbifer bruguierae TaxID=3029061 RepID=A0ABY8NCI4_9GAMM|nr:heavy metal translocating P-type ATPase [Microbulbifer bruguierae]WGL16634.1 heavy metal translocating P-type ATPase [Microbulbifer bruguierae]
MSELQTDQLGSTDAAAATRVATNQPDCYHCGLPVVDGSRFSVVIGGAARPMCCPGCEAVAGAIVAGGLDNFYRYREQNSQRPENTTQQERWSAYDLQEVQSEFVRDLDDPRSAGSDRSLQVASLLIAGITCAACVWLIEKHLLGEDGVERVSVNASSHRAQIVFDPERVPVSRLFAALAAIGYRPSPATAVNGERLMQQEKRASIRRLGVAGLGTMQVMMFAIALYFGASKGIESQFEQFFRWVSLIVATPVVCYAAQPFFAAAWRALRSGQLVMDVPVSLAIGLAYGASVYATVFETGEVYFESVSMFTFFLLLGRTIEMRARHRAGLASGGLAQLLPLAALRLKEGSGSDVESVPVAALRAGDRILLRPGDTIAADGEVVDGESGVDESVLTGESALQQKAAGSPVFAGSVNGDSSLTVRVTAAGKGTRLSAIEKLVESAQLDKPTQVALADRLAGRFIAAILCIAVAAFAFWWQQAPDRAFWIALSVLVVTCPCALSLATPAALAAATLRLQQLGLLVAKGHVLETLPRLTRVIFDKTGTLTEGEPRLRQVQLLRAGVTAEEVRDIAAALEAHNSHPLAKAFRPWVGNRGAHALRSVTGCGVSGVCGDRNYRLGRADFVLEGATGETVDGVVQTLPIPEEPGQWLLLGDTGGAVAWLGLGDEMRQSAPAGVAALRELGLKAELLSGDQSAEVPRLATLSGIDTYRAGASPEDKLAHLQHLQAQGERLLMVGDGINDVPVLSGADVSVAMMSAADLAQSRADAILLQGDLQALPRAFELAQKCRTIIRQNLAWAILYNALALPLAFLGLVPPWAAAIGMSLSSLIVVINALRLSRWQPAI